MGWVPYEVRWNANMVKWWNWTSPHAQAEAGCGDVQRKHSKHTENSV